MVIYCYRKLKYPTPFPRQTMALSASVLAENMQVATGSSETLHLNLQNRTYRRVIIFFCGLQGRIMKRIVRFWSCYPRHHTTNQSFVNSDCVLCRWIGLVTRRLQRKKKGEVLWGRGKYLQWWWHQMTSAKDHVMTTRDIMAGTKISCRAQHDKKKWHLNDILTIIHTPKNGLII